LLYSKYIFKKRHVEELNLPQHDRLYDMTMCYTQYTIGKVIRSGVVPCCSGPGPISGGTEEWGASPPPLLAPIYSTPHISFNFQPLLSVSPEGERTLLDLSSTEREKKNRLGF
jgi:hypothetical protein